MTAPARLTALALSLGALLAASSSRAEDPCATEVERHCAGKAPVDVLSCLQARRADLPVACRDRLESSLANIQAALNDCEPDAFQFCRGLGRGEPTTTCLSKSQGKLTWRCQQDFDAFARIESASTKACSAEASRYCGGVKPGKGDVYLCLVYRGSDLSPECRAALMR
jgi:hypothetical protein